MRQQIGRTAAMLTLVSCAADPTDGGDRDQVIAARILPAPLPSLLIGETVQLRLETRTRGGEQLETTTAEWSLTEGSGTISQTGVLTAARSGTVAGSFRASSPGFDLLASGYQGVTLTLAAVDEGLVYGRILVAGTDGTGAAHRASGTVIAAHPDWLRILLLPDGKSRFPLVLEEAWFRWEARGAGVRLIQTDETLAWRFPTGQVRDSRDRIDLTR